MMIKAKAWYPKVLGQPVPGYDKTKREWSIDICVDDKTHKMLLKEGMDSSYFKNKGDDRGFYFTYRRPEFRKDGTQAKMIEIVDHRGHPWDQKKLIGNGSDIHVLMTLNDSPTKKGQKPGVFKIQVWEHIPYEGGEREEFPTRDDEETWDGEDE